MLAAFGITIVSEDRGSGGARVRTPFGNLRSNRGGSRRHRGNGYVGRPEGRAHVVPGHTDSSEVGRIATHRSVALSHKDLSCPITPRVVFNVTSLDVVHSFSAYQLEIEADADPQANDVAFDQDRTARQTPRIAFQRVLWDWAGAMFNYGESRLAVGVLFSATRTEAKNAANTGSPALRVDVRTRRDGASVGSIRRQRHALQSRRDSRFKQPDT